MNVIGHQAIAAHREFEALRLLREQMQIHAPIVVGEKNVLPIVPALGDVVWNAGNNNARDTGHKWKSSKLGFSVN